MNRGMLLAAIAIVMALDNASAAQPTAGPAIPEGYKAFAVSPIYSQIVAHRLPAEFKPAFENQGPTSYIREAILKNDTLEDWSQMITVTGIDGKAAPAGASAMVLLQGIAAGFQKTCPGTFAAKALGKVMISTYDGVAALVGCGSITKGKTYSEILFVIAVKGANDYYTFQWAERGPPVETPAPLDDAKWKARYEQLRPMKICDRVPGEAAPYPSCIDRP